MTDRLDFGGLRRPEKRPVREGWRRTCLARRALTLRPSHGGDCRSPMGQRAGTRAKGRGRLKTTSKDLPDVRLALRYRLIIGTGRKPCRENKEEAALRR